MSADNRNLDISVLESNWDGIKVKYCHMAATGDFSLAMPQDGISIAFAPHDRTIWSVDKRSSQTTSVNPGSILIHRDRDFVWHDREKASEWIYIELEPQVLTRIAKESGLLPCHYKIR